MSALKNAINGYFCKNNHSLITINSVEGTIPMFVTCPVCSERAASTMGKVGPEVKPTHEWYKPSEEQCRADAIAYANEHEIDPDNVVAGFLQHLKKGGLFLRKLKQ